MAYYINKEEPSNKEAPTQDARQQKFFYQILGAGIVVVVVAVIGIVSGLR